MADLPYEVEVPDKLLEHYRLISGDLPEYNKLIDGVEIDNARLTLAFQLWLQSFNNIPPVLDAEYTFENFPNYSILFEGVLLKTLQMAGIVETRNFFNFNDGGVSFTVADKGQAYQAWISGLVGKHMQDVENLKIALNAEEGYEIIDSPEAMIFPYYDY